MQKTKKSVVKRFKVTGTGKVFSRTKGHRHLLRSKSARQKQRAGQDRPVSKGFSAQVLNWIGPAL